MDRFSYRMLGRTSAAALMVALWSSASLSQDNGGLEASVSLSQGFTFSDISGTSGRTDLGFDLSSTTRSQSLGFSLNGQLVQDLEDGFAATLENPRAVLSYDIESAQSALTAGLSYRKSDATGLSADSDEALGILFLDDGNREIVNGSLGLVFGRDMPFGGAIDLGFTDKSYSDTTSPELIDSQRTSAGVSLRFDVDERITTTLGYTWSDEQRDSGRDTLSQGLTLGGELAVSPTLAAAVSFGLTEITVTDGLTETQSDGLTYGLRLTQSRPLGALTFSLDSNLSEAGRRTTATLGASYETRSGTFDASFGLTEGTDNTTRPLLALSYDQPLPLGSVTVSLQQGFETTDLGAEALNSRLRLTWQQDLTRVTRMNTSLAYQITDVLGADEDSERITFNFSYVQDLSDDWSLTTAYTNTQRGGDRRRSTTENEIFIGLETSFGWRP